MARKDQLRVRSTAEAWDEAVEESKYGKQKKLVDDEPVNIWELPNGDFKVEGIRKTFFSFKKARRAALEKFTKKNPLIKGYSQASIAKNIAQMKRDGMKADRAEAAAYRIAREAWRDRHPRGPYPAHLKQRTRPKSSGRRARRNPVGGGHARYRRAVKLYTDFHGESPKYVDEYEIDLPSHALQIGRLEGVIYSCRMDGKHQRFLHEFTGKSRPILAVSADGTQLLVLDGDYRFTDRGIVDGYAEVG